MSKKRIPQKRIQRFNSASPLLIALLNRFAEFHLKPQIDPLNAVQSVTIRG